MAAAITLNGMTKLAKRYRMLFLTGMTACILAGCGAGDTGETVSTVATVASSNGSAGSGGATVTASDPTAIDVGSHVPPAEPVAAATELPPLDLSDMRLWNWDGKWHASEWVNDMSPIPWKYAHVQQRPDKSVDLILDAGGAPQLQAMKGTDAHASGLWQTEVTLPQLRDGVVVAPLWLYNSGNRDEIDFEFAGRKGLDVTMHAYPGGKHRKQTVRLFEGQDFSSRTVRFGISVNMQAGEAEMIVDDLVVHVFRKADMGWFVTSPLKPWMEMWPANPGNTGFVDWVGRWQGMSGSDEMRMRIHGYAYNE